MRRSRLGLMWGLVFLAGSHAGTAAAAAVAAQTPSAPPDASPAEVIARIARSHVEGNIPPPAQFDVFLRRDLTAYFVQSTNRKVTIKYEMLRNGPTQSGVSSPKYYLWVRVFQNKKLLDAGAVRVAAIDRKQWEVTSFLSQKTMKRDPEQIYQTFPRPVGDKIKKDYLKR